MKLWHRVRAGRVLSRPWQMGGWLLSGLAVTRYYQNLIGEHGISSYALAERADEKASAFYEHLFQDVALPASVSVLDIGCGLGDLIPFMQARGFTITRYMGLDLVQAFVDECARRYGPPFAFRCQNFVSPLFRANQPYTVVVNMGCMVSRVTGYEDYVAYTCTRMMHCATDAVLFNVITAVRPSKDAYTDTDKIGQITVLPLDRLTAILDVVTAGTPWTYTLHNASIYPDGTDTFVYMHRRGA